MRERLNIDITARNRTGGAFRTVNNGLREIDSRVGVLTGGFRGLAAAAGLGALAAGLRNVTANLAAMVDTADKIGLTTTQLQELHHIAQQAGIGTDTLNMAMQRFTRRLARLWSIPARPRGGGCQKVIGRGIRWSCWLRTRH